MNKHLVKWLESWLSGDGSYELPEECKVTVDEFTENLNKIAKMGFKIGN